MMSWLAFLTAMLWVGTADAQSSESPSSTPIPSWRLGIPTFNGTGYDLPPTGASAPAEAPSSGSSASSPQPSRPYTVPTAPGSNAICAIPSGLDFGGSSSAGSVASVNPYVSSSPDSSSSLVMPREIDSAAAQANHLADQLGVGISQAGTPVAGDLPSSVRPVSDQSLSMPLVPPAEDLPPPPSPAAEAISSGSVGSGSVGSGSVDSGSSGSGASDGIAQQISQTLDTAGGGIETPPLQQEVVRWYQYPSRWMKGWDSHAEFGLDGSDGNAETLAIQTGLEMKRQTDVYTFAIDIDYRQASARDVTTEDNGRVNLDYDRLLGGSPWSAFGKFGMEWDEFKAFDLRLNLNGGVGYHWIRDDTTTLVTRFGAGSSKEIGAPDDDWKAEAVFGIEAERQVNSRNKVKAKLDYFPAWEDFGDYRLVADVAWEILLNDEENFSLKLSATDRYDSTPQGFEANDLYYSLLLLYKF